MTMTHSDETPSTRSSASTTTTTVRTDQAERSTSPPAHQHLGGTRLVLLATAIGLVLNIALEIAEAAALPHMREFLLFNVVAVSAWSLGGLAIGLGLLRLGRTESRRTTVAWVAAVMALVTAAPLFWSAVPASIAAAGVALATGRRGSLAAARVVSVVAFIAFLAVSIGMFPFTEV